MKFHFLHFCPGALLLLALLSQQNCTNPAPQSPPGAPSPQGVKAPLRLDTAFAAYWFQGEAELNVYSVEQERYGALRSAQQVMIFVTEDLSKTKQVKLDHPAQAGNDRVPVLKINAIRRFHTGIYDYSLMESVFTPLDGSPTVKTTATVQDWCGQVYAQFNRNGQRYQIHAFSYFESEGDTEITLDAGVVLESDFWTRLRIAPENIPLGAQQVAPSAIFSRLRHQPFQAHLAQVSMEPDQTRPGASWLRIEYQSLPRSVAIQFETAFPHRILGWEEYFQGQPMSKGTLQSTQKSAYWKHNQPEDANLRDALHLWF